MSPRRFLQLHLSTALVMMVLAGGMVWLNVRKEQVYNTAVKDELRRHSGLEVLPCGVDRYIDFEARGWPWHFHVFNVEVPTVTIRMLQKNNHLIQKTPRIDSKQLSLNVMVALGILAAAGVGV